MSNCSSQFDWNFLLRPDDPQKDPVDFGVSITDSAGGSLTGRVTRVGSTTVSGPPLSECRCRADPKHGGTILSFKVNMSRNSGGGATEIRKFIIVGHVTPQSIFTKFFHGAYFFTASAPGEEAMLGDPGDTGTGGGTTGA